VDPALEAQHYVYLVRLFAFALIIAGIVDKNRRDKRSCTATGTRLSISESQFFTRRKSTRPGLKSPARERNLYRAAGLRPDSGSGSKSVINHGPLKLGGFVNRRIIVLCLLATSAGCAGHADNSKGQMAHNEASSAKDFGPHYASEAQRARAQNFWLPQNQLPPDTGVAAPANGG
jgi:hypothetical protein